MTKKSTKKQSLNESLIAVYNSVISVIKDCCVSLNVARTSECVCVTADSPLIPDFVLVEFLRIARQYDFISYVSSESDGSKMCYTFFRYP